jgi:hypothetical protein
MVSCVEADAGGFKEVVLQVRGVAGRITNPLTRISNSVTRMTKLLELIMVSCVEAGRCWEFQGGGAAGEAWCTHCSWHETHVHAHAHCVHGMKVLYMHMHSMAHVCTGGGIPLHTLMATSVSTLTVSPPPPR